jgi:hypothetical protein
MFDYRTNDQDFFVPAFMICQAGTEFIDLMKLKLNSFIENYLPAGMQGPNIFYLYNTGYNEKTELNRKGDSFFEADA